MVSKTSGSLTQIKAVVPTVLAVIIFFTIMYLVKKMLVSFDKAVKVTNFIKPTPLNLFNILMMK